MRTITQTAYFFEELSEEAQTRAVDNYRANPDIFDNYDYECAVEIALEAFHGILGLDDTKTDLTGHTDLSFSQGDGFNVTGTVPKPDKIPAWWPKDAPSIVFVPNQLHPHYSHEGTVDAYPVNSAGWVETSPSLPVSEMTEATRDAMRAGYRDAEKLYLSVTSDENIREQLESSDFEYYANGVSL